MPINDIYGIITILWYLKDNGIIISWITEGGEKVNKIDAIKKEKRLSYGDISKSTGLTTAYICMLAKGQKTNPSKETMEKIAAALHKTVADVFFPKIRDKTIKKSKEVI